MTAGRLIPLCHRDDIQPDTGAEFAVAGIAVAVFRTRAGGFFALHADCPHRDGPLADGIVAGGYVTCPLHNWKIDLRTGETPQDACARVQIYAVEVRNETVCLRLPLAAPRHEVLHA